MTVTGGEAAISYKWAGDPPWGVTLTVPGGPPVACQVARRPELDRDGWAAWVVVAPRAAMPGSVLAARYQPPGSVVATRGAPPLYSATPPPPPEPGQKEEPRPRRGPRRRVPVSLPDPEPPAKTPEEVAEEPPAEVEAGWHDGPGGCGYRTTARSHRTICLGEDG